MKDLVGSGGNSLDTIFSFSDNRAQRHEGISCFSIRDLMAPELHCLIPHYFVQVGVQCLSYQWLATADCSIVVVRCVTTL